MNSLHDWYCYTYSLINHNITPLTANYEDLNECKTDNGGCEHICTNTEGSFQCSCNDGYTLQSDGTNCTDDDECSLGAHNCEQLCINTAGGFRCQCMSGYQLKSDGVHCSGTTYTYTIHDGMLPFSG